MVPLSRDSFYVIEVLIEAIVPSKLTRSLFFGSIKNSHTKTM
jgi:hypothetical protein